MDKMVVEVNGRRAEVEFPAEAGMLSRKLIRGAVEVLLLGARNINSAASTEGHEREVKGGIDKGKMHLEFYSWKGDQVIWGGPLKIVILD